MKTKEGKIGKSFLFQGREFTELELSLLKKVEMERASLLPTLIKANPRDIRERKLQRRCKINYLSSYLNGFSINLKEGAILWQNEKAEFGDRR